MHGAVPEGQRCVARVEEAEFAFVIGHIVGGPLDRGVYAAVEGEGNVGMGVDKVRGAVDRAADGIARGEMRGSFHVDREVAG